VKRPAGPRRRPGPRRPGGKEGAAGNGVAVRAGHACSLHYAPAASRGADERDCGAEDGAGRGAAGRRTR
jgi:hypothetical protein